MRYLTTQNDAHPDMKTIYGCSLQMSAEHSKSSFRSSCYTHLSVSTKLKLIYALSASKLPVPGFLNTHIISQLNAELSEDKQEAKLLWLLTAVERWRNSMKSEHSTTTHVGGFSFEKHQNKRKEERLIPCLGIFSSVPLKGTWSTSS